MKKILGFILAGLVALSVAAPAISAHNPPGNNGTLKIHEIGTPSGTESNDPKVCKFDIEGFNFDVGQTGYILIEGQGQTKLNHGPFTFGPANSDGYYKTQSFNTGSVVVDDGHYKATLYGKTTGRGFSDKKAKSKVFKVQCQGRPSPSPSVSPQPSPTATPVATPSPSLTPTPSPTTETPSNTPTPSASENSQPTPSTSPSLTRRSTATMPPTDTDSATNTQGGPSILAFMLLGVIATVAGVATLLRTSRRDGIWK